MTATELSSFHTVLETLRVKYWEIIADNLSKAGWSWGYVSAVNSDGRMDAVSGFFSESIESSAWKTAWPRPIACANSGNCRISSRPKPIGAHQS